MSGFRGAVDASLAALRGGLRQRAEVSASREVLELLLDTFHVVSKIEKLIKELPSTAPDWSNAETAPTENGGLSNDNVENVANLRETQSILLERIASEMNRLRFYINHAKDLPFVENMEKRIQSATLLLDESLGHCYINALEHRDANAIYNCLRAYAAVDNTSAAEELFRTTIVSPLIEKIIPSTHSEMVDGASSDDLENDYQQIMICIEKDCKFLLDISTSANSGLHVFNFLANSILKEVLFAIQKGKPGAFSPGRPTEFLKNYKSSLGFLAYLEAYCSSRSGVVKFRSEAVYIDFMRQWNVGVYFSLRFQEIAGSLDSALLVPTLTPLEMSHDNRGKHQELTLKQSVTLLESLRSCWRGDVLLLSCSDKFLRLSLQLLSRYTTWLSSGLAARKARGGSSTPIPNSEWASAADVADLIFVVHDVGFLVTELTGDYLEHVLQLLESCTVEVRDLVKQSVLQAAKSLENLLPALKETMIESIVEKSVEDLRQLKGITAKYRMTNNLPVRHSPYVSGLLRPLKGFLNGDRVACLSNEDLTELVLGVAERITARYMFTANEAMELARKTEISLKKLSDAAKRRGASSDALDNNVSDLEKIRMQLFLDVQEYGRNLAELGVEVADFPAYQELWKAVAPEERQKQIVL